MSRLTVLMYHRVAPRAAGPLAHLTISPERFAWQMAKLREGGFAPQRQAEVAAWLGGRGTLSGRAVVVSFDDGYAENVEHAFPVLEKLRIPAVTFVVTGKLGGRNDWDGDTAPWPLMDGASIRHWARRGLEFGVHGRTHRSLPALDDAALAHEIDGAQADLVALLGETPVAFAYPYGHVTGRVHERVARRFAVAYGTADGINSQASDPWLLRRTAVLPAYPGFEFMCQLRLGWGPRNRARTVVRRMLGRSPDA
ncbi:MAG TPA: polysaccharide deacetylase family protein [Alphaproteobacteria bacterium]|nr:polysaccharide deacetylase family protein [Alphaproteobacteria bacterium]